MANVVTDIALRRSFGVLPLEERDEAPDTMEFHGYTGRFAGLVVVLDVTAVTATPALTLTVQGVDGGSGKTWDIVKNTAAIATTGTRIYRIRPSLAAVNTDPNFTVSDVLPPVFRIACTHGDADAITYSVHAHLTY